MMNKKQFPKRRSIRLPAYDYTLPGGYFVTICSYERRCIFGNIIDNQMKLSTFVEIVKQEWLNNKNKRSYVQLDEFVVMPNHFHGILFITDGRASQRDAPTKRWMPGSLGAVINQFKSVTTKRIIQIHNQLDFKVWQRNYYEHIIRKETVLYALREYIVNNPLRWSLDELNPNKIYN